MLGRWAGVDDLLARLDPLRHDQPLDVPPEAVREQLAELAQGERYAETTGTVVVTCDCV